MRPWEYERITRDEAFEVYLKPDRPEGEASQSGPVMSEREQVFHHLRGGGLTWLQAEKSYQAWAEERRR